MSTLKLYKPTTAARRHTSVIDYKKIITTNDPHKPLLVRVKNNGGRNSSGKITVRHRGGGARKMVRIVNFKRNFEKGFKIQTIEYDPTRSGFICLVTCLKDGSKHYVLHTKGMEVGQKYNLDNELKDGNQVMLKEATIGSVISQIELNPGQGAKMVRSAGNYATVTARDEKYVSVKLPSGEVRKFLGECKCVINRVGNDAHGLVRIGKAGTRRHMGFRPTVRGKVMNPVDHPHGGGEGRNPIGMKFPKTPWSKPALGVKTRLRKKPSNRLIVNRRTKKKR